MEHQKPREPYFIFRRSHSRDCSLPEIERIPFNQSQSVNSLLTCSNLKASHASYRPSQLERYLKTGESILEKVGNYDISGMGWWGSVLRFA